MNSMILVFIFCFLKFEIIGNTWYPSEKRTLNGIYFLWIMFVFFEGYAVRILVAIYVVNPDTPRALVVSSGRSFMGQTHVQSMRSWHSVCITAAILVDQHAVHKIFPCWKCNGIPSRIYKCAGKRPSR